MQRAFLSAICLFLAIGATRAQEIGNSLSYRNVGSERYFRVNYMNDLAFGTDYYYTQGAHFEVLSPGIGRLPTRVLFPRIAHSARRYGIALESAGYTQTTIFADSILYGDRPFAGMAYLKALMLATDSAGSGRISATLTVGLMGPAAGGYEIQAAIHRRTGNADPVGWKHQVGNAIILNYELSYERALFYHPYLLLSATGMLRGGTYSIKVALGGILMAGLFDNPYGRTSTGKGIRAYLYVHPQLDLIGYDATLQGGLFTSNSPYTISGGDISRAVFRCDGGWRIGYRDIWLSMYARYLSKEFASGLDHATGGFEITLPL